MVAVHSRENAYYSGGGQGYYFSGGGGRGLSREASKTSGRKYFGPQAPCCQKRTLPCKTSSAASSQPPFCRVRGARVAPGVCLHEPCRIRAVLDMVFVLLLFYRFSRLWHLMRFPLLIPM